MKVILMLPRNFKIFALVVLILVLTGAGGCYAQRLLYGVASGVTVNGYNVGRYFPHEVSNLVNHLAIELNRPPKDAMIAKDGSIIAEIPGVRVDIEKSVARIINADRNETVELVIRYPKPDLTAQLLKQINEPLGSFTTFVSGSENRAKNIALAAETINFTLVRAQTLFSFNKVVGPPNLERGYKPAPVIMGGALVMGAGGGVCQVSSTLYNATLAAKLKVVERHPHSKRVRYVPVGRDAAIGYPGTDFKFYNQYTEPVIVRTQMQGRTLKVWVLGTKEISDQIKGGD